MESRKCSRCHKEKPEIEYYGFKHKQCKACLRVKSNYYKSVTKKNHILSFFKKVNISPEQIGTIKRLITKYEYKFMNQYDHFRIISIHSELNISYQEAHLTSIGITEEKRLELIVQHLRMVLEQNGIFRYQAQNNI